MTTRTITVEEYYFVYVRSLLTYPHTARFDKRVVTSVIFDLANKYKLTLSDKSERILDAEETVTIEDHAASR